MPKINLDPQSEQSILNMLLDHSALNDSSVSKIVNTSKEIGKTKIDSVLGEIDTVIIRKEIEGSKRSTITWYAQERNYLPVRIEQYRLNELRFKAEIDEYKRKLL